MWRFLSGVLLGVAALAASGCREDATVTVHSLTLNGVTAVDVSTLKSVLATRENTKIPLLGIRVPWSKSRNYFDRGRFEADLKRIEAFYKDRGYPDARVASFDVQLNDAQDAVDITLTIAEGEPTTVAGVQFLGFDLIPPDRLTALRDNSPLVQGEPRDRQTVVRAHEVAVNELRDHGYPYARVATAEVEGPGPRQVTVTFTAEPGTLAHVGTVEISGNRSVGAEVIRRQLAFKPGDLYRRSDVLDTQRRLYAMELFQFVNVELLNPELQAPDVRMRVTVGEGKHQRVNAGVGYGTEEKARVEGEYHHVNFFGGARSAGAHARWSSLDRGVRLDFIQPYLFAQSLTFRTDGQRWYTYTPAYRSVVTGARIALTQRSSAQTSWTVSVASERSNSEIDSDVLGDPDLYNDLISIGLDPTTGTQKGTLSSFGLDFERSTADSVLDPRRGYQIALHAEEAGRLLPGTFNFYAFSADGRHYVPFVGRAVVAHRIQLGNIHAADDDPAQVPFSKKYFLGGASSIRGWGRYEVSPLGGSGLPIGGNTLFAFSSEARVVLRGRFGAVLFLDAGNVWEDHRSADLSDLRYAVGTGLRYATPIGPVRLDVGYQLNRVDGLLVDGEPQVRPWRLHFSIGQAF